MPPVRPFVATALLAATMLAGCGGSGTETFEQEGYPFTFDYPSDFELSTDVSFDTELGGTADDTVAVGLDDSNGIVLQRYTLNLDVTETNIDDAKAEFDSIIGDVDPSASAEVGDVAGFPSLTYAALDVPQPEDGQSRITAFFDGNQEYLINCQSTPEERDAITEACDMALDTLTGS